MATFDLSKRIKNKTITLKKGSVETIKFLNDVAGQVVMSEAGNNIVFTVYKTEQRGYQYTRVVEKFVDIDESKTEVTTTKYTYTDGAWKQVGKSSTSKIDSSEKPALPGGRDLWVTYTMSSKSSSSKGSSSMKSSSYFSAKDGSTGDDSLDAMDGIYKTRVIDKFGSETKSLTQEVMAKIIVKNGNKAYSLAFESKKNGNYSVLDATFAPVRKGNKYTGTFLNETVMSSSANETFSLKTGNDNINYAFFDGQSKVGNDVINLAKNEILTLNMLNSTKNDETKDMYVNTGYQKKGNDLIMKFTNEDGVSLGKTTIKNYFKVAQDNVTLKYSGASSSVIDYEYSLKELLEVEDGIGFIGNEEATKKQTITGSFLDNVINGGSGKDTIKGVAGDNLIFAGKNDDTIYSGKGEDSFFILEGDATGSKGDMIYNADNNDSIYFLVKDGEGGYELGPAYFAETTDPTEPYDTHHTNFEFTKNGNNLVVRYNKNNVYSTDDKEKVTFVDYFKKNTELFNINDVEDYSKLTINQVAKGIVDGTNYNDDIYLKGKSTVYTGNGNDTIRFYNVLGTGSTYTIPVDANVTTIIDGTGIKTFERVLGYGADGGDMGNKTIVFQNQASKNATANLNLLGKEGTPEEPQPASDGYIYSKSGNNLVIEGYYSGQPGYVYNPEDEVTAYDTYGSYTIKDYFKDGNYVGDIYIDGNALDLTNVVLCQQGKHNKATTFYDTEYNDHLLGANKNDKYVFASGGKDRAFDIKGNDTYTIKVNNNSAEVKIFDNGKGNDKYNFTNSNLSSTVYINDDGGKKDALNITSQNPDAKISVGVLFNVLNDDYAGPAVESKFMKDDALFLYNKANNPKTSGHIEIGNYFAKDNEGKYSKGAGVIETMKLDGVNIDVSHLDDIRSQVVNFLTTEASASYASAYQCLMGNNETDIANLISAYTYNQTT